MQLESLNLDSNNCRKQASSKTIDSFDRLRLLAVLRFFRMLKKDPRSRVSSSEKVAEVVFGKDGASYRSRTIRDWGDHLPNTSCSPTFEPRKIPEDKIFIKMSGLHAFPFFDLFEQIKEML